MTQPLLLSDTIIVAVWHNHLWPPVIETGGHRNVWLMLFCSELIDCFLFILLSRFEYD